MCIRDRYKEAYQHYVNPLDESSIRACLHHNIFTFGVVILRIWSQSEWRIHLIEIIHGLGVLNTYASGLNYHSKLFQVLIYTCCVDLKLKTFLDFTTHPGIESKINISKRHTHYLLSSNMKNRIRNLLKNRSIM